MDEMQANAYLEDEKDYRQKHFDRLAEALSAYENVRHLNQHPGWETFILELQRESVVARQAVDDELDQILLSRNPERERAFTEAKIRLLACEQSIQLYITMRERARAAKEELDRMMPVEAELP